MKYLKLNKNFSQIQQAFNNNQRIVLRYNNSIIGELTEVYQQSTTRTASLNSQSKVVSFKLVNFITDYSFNPEINSNINLSNFIDFSTLDQTDIEEMEYYGIIIPNWEEENLYNMEVFAQAFS